MQMFEVQFEQQGYQTSGEFSPTMVGTLDAAIFYFAKRQRTRPVRTCISYTAWVTIFTPENHP
jgi:hypothetical protein